MAPPLTPSYSHGMTGDNKGHREHDRRSGNSGDGDSRWPGGIPQQLAAANRFALNLRNLAAGIAVHGIGAGLAGSAGAARRKPYGHRLAAPSMILAWWRA